MRLDVEDANSLFPLQNKFGARGNDIELLLKTIKGLELNLVGVSFHVGTDIKKPEAYQLAMEHALTVFDKAKEILGQDLQILDIGGGYPGEIDEVFQATVKAITSVKLPKHVQLIAEPGRFLVAPCMSIYATIISKRTVSDVIHYHINDGYFGNLGIDAARRIKPIPVPKNLLYEESEILAPESLKPTIIWGPTVTALDVITKNFLFPELKIGDHIYFQNMGAYTASLQTNYCGLKNDTDIYLEVGKDTDIHID